MYRYICIVSINKLKLIIVKNWQIYWIADHYNDEDKASFERQGVYNDIRPALNHHELMFKAYDDDGNLYFKGTCTDKGNALEDVFYWCQWDSGCTLVDFYYRTNKKLYDSIG